jgi:hypothetical protein
LIAAARLCQMVGKQMEFANRMDMVDKALKIQTPGSAESLRQNSEAYGREVGLKIQSQDSKKASA